MPSLDGASVLHNLRALFDMRGSLSVGEFGREIPLNPCVISWFPTFRLLKHAHLKCQQFLIAVKGSIRVDADDGKAGEEFVLDRNNLGLYLPAMTWGIQ